MQALPSAPSWNNSTMCTRRNSASLSFLPCAMPIRAAFLTAAGRASTMTRRRSSTRACASYSRLRTSVCPICWTRGDPQHDELNAGESASRESLFRQHVVVAQDARQLPLTVLLLPVVRELAGFRQAIRRAGLDRIERMGADLDSAVVLDRVDLQGFRHELARREEVDAVRLPFAFLPRDPHEIRA